MSSILSASDLNDFISPGVACINPVEVEKSNLSGKAHIEISVDGKPVELNENGNATSLKPAQISLSDCLACSGCITSAESVLVSLQTHKEVLSSLRSPDADKKIFVCSISHQVRVSLANAYGITLQEADSRLKLLLHQTLGFKYIVGLEIGRGIALEYGAKEVLEGQHEEGELDVNNSGTLSQRRKKPILSSNCPGWTCYVEKTHAEVIPYLSQVRSAQQITGAIIKELISNQHGIAKSDIYHLSIMPCFDKKLEAARPEFEVQGAKDVDCVITSKEVVQLLLEENMPFESLSSNQGQCPKDEDLSPRGWPYSDQWFSHSGTSSGGYLNYVLHALCASHDKPCHVDIVPGKNSDIVEFHVISDSSNQVIGRAAQVYGFRNIQNLVRKLKLSNKGGAIGGRTISKRQGRSVAFDPMSFDYIEVMACPGGCLNGGGQIGSPDNTHLKEWKESMEKLYNDMPMHTVTNAKVKQWLNMIGQEFNDQSHDIEQITATHFKPLEADIMSTAAISVGTQW